MTDIAIATRDVDIRMGNLRKCSGRHSCGCIFASAGEHSRVGKALRDVVVETRYSAATVSQTMAFLTGARTWDSRMKECRSIPLTTTGLRITSMADHAIASAKLGGTVIHPLRAIARSRSWRKRVDIGTCGRSFWRRDLVTIDTSSGLCPAIGMQFSRIPERSSHRL